MIQYRLSSTIANYDGLGMRADSDGRDFFWAVYNRNGVRVVASPAATDEWLAQADANAPAKAAELFGAREAAVVAKQTQEHATKGATKARYDGTCAVTGRRYVRNTMIRNTAYGWAIADATTMQTLTAGPSAMVSRDPNWLSRQMDREDSMF